MNITENMVTHNIFIIMTYLIVAFSKVAHRVLFDINISGNMPFKKGIVEHFNIKFKILGTK